MSEKLVTRQEHHEDTGALNTLRISRLLLPKAGSVFIARLQMS